MILKEIKERYSVRNFLDKEVPEKVLKEVLEAGRLAPSWINVQPWHFIVVREKINRALLHQLSHAQPHVEQAPVLILCCGDKRAWEEENFMKMVETRPGMTSERLMMISKSPAYNPGLRGEEAILYRTLEELTYAVAYMTLEAHAQGLGACIIGGIGNELTESVPEVYGLARKTFKLPEDVMIMAMLAVGYPAEDKPPFEKDRKAFDEVVSFEAYGNKK